jgi:hypothetical protein
MKHNRAAAPAWPVPRHALVGTRGNGGAVTLQFREVFERFVQIPIALTDLFDQFSMSADVCLHQ